MKTTTFQKINLLLISYLIVCFISEVIVVSIDINNYQQIEKIKAQKEFIWQSIEWASIFIMVLFLIIIPNVFSIVVHDLKSSLVPPIHKLSILLKNLPIYLSIFITLTALVSLAFLKDNEVTTFLANKIAGNRINSHDKANLGINIMYFSLFLLFILPLI